MRFFSIYSCLKLWEFALKIESLTQEMSDSEFELRLFKSLLRVNQIVEDRKPINPKFESSADIRNFFMANSYWNWEVENYRPLAVLFVEMIKSIYFFEFIESQTGGNLLLQVFNSDYVILNHREYIRIILDWSINLLIGGSIIRSEYLSEFSNPVNSKLLERMSSYSISENDFGITWLKENPIVKLKSGDYLIMFDQFFFEKLYKTLYFQFKEIHSNTENSGIKNFRSFYCHSFSEKYLFYKVIEKIFGSNYKQISGAKFEQDSIDGAPDYYIRNGRKIFVFESKDVLMPSNVRYSDSLIEYQKLLEAKFYRSNGQKRSVIQLAEFISTLFNDEFSSDKIPSNFVVYPIVILHHREYNVPGVNDLLQEWFAFEVSKFKLDTRDLKKIKPITIVLVDDLIYFRENFRKRDFKLDEVLNSYHNFVKREINQKNYSRFTIQKYISFSDYLFINNSAIFERRVLKVLEEEVLNLFGEV